MDLHLQKLLAIGACEERIMRRAGTQGAKRFE